MAEQRDEFGVPEGLAEGLRAAYRGSGGVEEKVDRAVIGAFGRRRAMRWWWGGAVAAGVAVVIGGGVWWQMEVRERGVAVAAAEGA
ncbi:MAG TPA: hypothetical protein VH253_07190, partial [Phycisphaerae bacterium]|nr:hypothetical protein [Phycisphaerae bacterium]